MGRCSLHLFQFKFVNCARCIQYLRCCISIFKVTILCKLQHYINQINVSSKQNQKYYMIVISKPATTGCCSRCLGTCYRQRLIETLIRNMLLLENPQFLPNFTHEQVILKKCHYYWVKIVGFKKILIRVSVSLQMSVN